MARYTQQERLAKKLAECRRIAERLSVDALQSPSEVAEYMQALLAGAEQEELWVILLDTRLRPIAASQVYKGSLNTSLVRVGELFREAIRKNAASLILFHNHPSGNPMPSPEDASLTSAAVRAGKLLDIPVLDHIIVGSAGYVSLKASGQMEA